MKTRHRNFNPWGDRWVRFIFWRETPPGFRGFGKPRWAGGRSTFLCGRLTIETWQGRAPIT